MGINFDPQLTCCDAQSKLCITKSGAIKPIMAKRPSTSELGVLAMSSLATQGQTMEVDVMQVWADRAKQQRAAFDAIVAYMRQQ